MTTKKILAHSLALAVLVLPAVALAHGGVDDGHVEAVVDTRPTGASALLVPMSLPWIGLLAASSVITAGLSYWVYRYIQVAPVGKSKPEEKK
jgi:hypothetical protein